MDPNTLKLLMGSAGAGAVADKAYIEDVFSTYLYTGNGSTQTITNGIDLSGKGGLTWIKGRSGTTGHRFVDTVRGATKSLESNSTAVEATESTGLTAFSSTGFSLGADTDYNTSSATYTSWTFRKAAKFFDVVTYTGTGANRTVAHTLGSVPGTIIVKRTDTSADWQVYHRSLANTEYLVLNSAAAKATGATRWNSTTPTSTVFSLGTDTTVNASGGTYVAYLFAHDAGGFGDSGNDNVISCGTFTSNGSGNAVVNLGWEPQWVLLKKITAQNWFLVDTLRGLPATTSGSERFLVPNDSATELSGSDLTGGGGFYICSLNNTGFSYNFQSNATYVYIAIRRGPMKTPTDATKVFSAIATTSTAGTVLTTNFPVDLQIAKLRTIGQVFLLTDRLRGINTSGVAGQNVNYLLPSFVSAEALDTNLNYSNHWSSASFKLPVNNEDTSSIFLSLRRAPGFFDMVAYTGDGTSNRSLAHNLGVTPELIIVKSRNDSGSWRVWSASFANSSANLDLNSSGAPPFANNFFPATGRNNLNFVVNSAINTGTTTFIAYLFASCPGISKVGGYTGTGTTLNIDCGFTAGARFVLIKRTDSTGDWYIWDTARGIVAGNDPFLLLNSSAAENTGTDYIDPLSSGFQISSTAPAAINANGGTYIYLSVA